jgi:hypothetical protein
MNVWKDNSCGTHKSHQDAIETWSGYLFTELFLTFHGLLQSSGQDLLLPYFTGKENETQGMLPTAKQPVWTLVLFQFFLLFIVVFPYLNMPYFDQIHPLYYSFLSPHPQSELLTTIACAASECKAECAQG